MGHAPRLRPSCASQPGLLRAAPVVAHSPGRDRARTPRGSPGLPRALLSRLHLPDRAALLLTPPLRSLASASASSSRSTRLRHTPSPELVVPAAPVRRSHLHLASSIASTFRNRCSSLFAVVSLLRPVIPRRSKLFLAGAWLCADSPSPLHLSPSFRAHEHRLAVAKLLRASPRPAVVGVGVPPMSRTSTPPCTPPSSILSSSHAFSWCTASASSRVRCWWWPRHRLAHRRRELAGQLRPCLSLTDRWGPLTVGTCSSAP